MKKTVMFNPFTGNPRHPSDIASDPEGVLIVEDLAAPMIAAPKTDAERQADRRKREKAKGLEEVRGIWAPKVDHEAIKQAAAKVTAKTARRRKKEQSE